MFAIQITHDGKHKALIVGPTETEAHNAVLAWFHKHCAGYSMSHALTHEGWAHSEPFAVQHKWTIGTAHFRSLPDAAKQHVSIQDAERAKKEGAIHIGLMPPETAPDETCTLDRNEGRYFKHVWERI